MRVIHQRPKGGKQSFVPAALAALTVLFVGVLAAVAASHASDSAAPPSKPAYQLVSPSEPSEPDTEAAAVDKSEDKIDTPAVFGSPFASQFFVRESEPNDTPPVANGLPTNDMVALGYIYQTGADVDFWSFRALAGSRVYAALQTAFSAGSTDSALDLIAPDGVTIIETDLDDGTFSTTSSSIAGAVLPGPPGVNVYYLRVRQQPASPLGSGSIRPYYLHFRVQGGPPTFEVEPNDTLGSANPVPPGGFIAGVRTPALDVDVYSIPLAAGDTVFLSLDMDPERDGVTWNGRLGFGLFGDAGTLVLLADDANVVSPNSEAFFFTVQNAGLYFVVVDSAGATGNTYGLSISVHPPVPEGINCTTYTSGDVPKVIPAGGGLVSSVVAVPAVVGRIADIDVSIQLNHANMPDLDVHLRSPAGNDNGLFSDIGAAAQTLMDLTLDDEAGLPISSYNVDRAMVYQPELSYRLGWFDGEQGGGLWTLDIRDDTANAAGGNLTGWSVTICEQPPAPITCNAGSVLVVAYSSDFEGGTGGFTHSGILDEWERGLPILASAPILSCNSGTNCWKTDLDNTYENSSNQDLLSPNIDLTGLEAPIEASWAQRFHMESASFDHARAIVRKVGPSQPTTLFEWLDATMNDSVGTPSVTVPESSGWSLLRRDIGAYAGSKIELLYHVDTDSSVQLSGYAIDDVRVIGCCSPASCDDGNVCTQDTCDPSQGCVHVINPAACDDGDPCTTDSCDPGTGMCLHAPFICNDLNDCTNDTCVPFVGCQFTNDDTNPCTDGNLCTSDACSGGACVSTPSVVCNDGNDCTDDACDPGTGLCVFTNDDTNTCSDGNVCTNDVCVGGACQCPVPPTTTNYTSVDVPKAISAVGTPTVTSTLTVVGSQPYIWDVNALTRIVHSFASDIDMTLQSPAGTVVTLTTDNGGVNDDVFNGTTWDDSADFGNPLPFPGSPTFVASRMASDHTYANLVVEPALAPEEALAAFIGENPNGVWTLTISDDANVDGGSLDDWGLDITAGTGPLLAFTGVIHPPDGPIADGGPPLNSVVIVAGAPGRVHEIIVDANIAHPASADLDVTLTSPTGTVVTLTSDNGLGNSYAPTTWRDKADPDGQVPYVSNPGMTSDDPYTVNPASPLAPEEPLGAFRGENPNGVWTLSVQDDLAGGGAGSLDGWRLTVITGTLPPCAVNCDDGDLCTSDSCDPILGCQHAAVVCDDGIACTSDSCNPGSGCVFTPLTPPGEVSPLDHASNKTTINWPPDAFATSYDVVRGPLGSLPVGAGGPPETCLGPVGVPSVNDATVPPVGTGLFYVVRPKNQTCPAPTQYGLTHTNPGPPLNGPARTTSTCP